MASFSTGYPICLYFFGTWFLANYSMASSCEMINSLPHFLGFIDRHNRCYKIKIAED